MSLVMSGSMGTGKTVTTAYVVDHMIHLNQHTLPGNIICYHYCNTDENSEAVYIYSSILQQVLHQQPGLKIKFDKWYEDTRGTNCIDPTQSSQMLGLFLAECLKSLDRTVIIIIDGLDECNDQSLPEILTLLRTMSEKTPRLKVFLSSRPGEAIEAMELLHEPVQIALIPDRSRDEAIVDHVVSNNLKGLSESTRNMVISRLRDAAEGSAIWITLTVDLMRRRKISAHARMEAFFRDMPLPNELSQLYSRLFHETTNGDHENSQLVANALETLAVTRRPLSILELGWVSALHESLEDVTSETAVSDVENWVDERRILDLVQPFILYVDTTDVKRSQVRLVHQSLRSLILRYPPSTWSGSQSLDKMSKAERLQLEQRQSALEAQLLNVSVRYLLLSFGGDEVNLLPKDEEEILVLGDLPLGNGFDEDEDDANTPSDDDPGDTWTSQPRYFDPSESGFGGFFVYASCYWLEHFRASPWELSPGISDIVELCRPRSTRLLNWAEQYCRPECTVLPRFSWWNTGRLDPLVITASFGPGAAVEAVLDGYDITGPGFLSHSLKATMEHLIDYRQISRFCSFLQQKSIGLTAQTLPWYMMAMAEWTDLGPELCDIGARNEFYDLIYDMIPLLLTDSWGNELLCSAAHHGCLPVMERLFNEAGRRPELRAELLRDRDRQTDPNRHDKHQSVGEAVRSRRVEALRYLLQQPGIETHLRHRDIGGANVFALPSCNRPEIVRLLVESYPEGLMDADGRGTTALSYLVSHGAPIESVRILLGLEGMDLWTRGPDTFFYELRVAVRIEHVEMCAVLVEEGGADPRVALRIGDDGLVLGLVDSIPNEKAAEAILDLLCRLGGLTRAKSLSLNQ